MLSAVSNHLIMEPLYNGVTSQLNKRNVLTLQTTMLNLKRGKKQVLLSKLTSESPVCNLDSLVRQRAASLRNPAAC